VSRHKKKASLFGRHSSPLLYLILPEEVTKRDLVSIVIPGLIGNPFWHYLHCPLR
jgi:hypothetical protein